MEVCQNSGEMAHSQVWFETQQGPSSSERQASQYSSEMDQQLFMLSQQYDPDDIVYWDQSRDGEPRLTFPYIAQQIASVDKNGHSLDLVRVLSAIALWLERSKDKLRLTADFFGKNSVNPRRNVDFRRISTDYWLGRSFHLDDPLCWAWFRQTMKIETAEKLGESATDIANGLVRYKDLGEYKETVRNHFNQMQNHIGRYFMTNELMPITAAFVLKIFGALGLDFTKLKDAVYFLTEQSKALRESDATWANEIILPASFANIPSYVENGGNFENLANHDFELELAGYIQRVKEEGIEAVHYSVSHTQEVEVGRITQRSAAQLRQEQNVIEKRLRKNTKQMASLRIKVADDKKKLETVKFELGLAESDEKNDKDLVDYMGRDGAMNLIVALKQFTVDLKRGDRFVPAKIVEALCGIVNLNPKEAMTSVFQVEENIKILHVTAGEPGGPMTGSNSMSEDANIANAGEPGGQMTGSNSMSEEAITSQSDITSNIHYGDQPVVSYENRAEDSNHGSGVNDSNDLSAHKKKKKRKSSSKKRKREPDADDGCSDDKKKRKKRKKGTVREL